MRYETPEDLPGDPIEPICDVCGVIVYDKDAECINGNRLCRVPCARDYFTPLEEDSA